MRQPLNAYKYLLTLVITLLIFGTIFYINNSLENQRVKNVKSIQDSLALDILSSETQFDLLKDASCKNLDGSILSQEINSIATKLSYLESNSDDKPSDEITYLKKYYSLLQIKDFLLMKQLSDKCSTKPISVLYFYGKKADCPDCEKMGYILTYLRENYPQLRIYSFDTNLDLSAINTLKSVYKVDEHELPAIVHEDKLYVGFRTIDEMKEIIPMLRKIDLEKAAASKATSTTPSTTSATKTAGTINNTASKVASTSSSTSATKK